MAQSIPWQSNLDKISSDKIKVQLDRGYIFGDDVETYVRKLQLSHTSGANGDKPDWQVGIRVWHRRREWLSALTQEGLSALLGFVTIDKAFV